jgi:hypothetical protein
VRLVSFPSLCTTWSSVITFASALPLAVTLAAAREQDQLQLPLVRVIFKMREVALVHNRAASTPPRTNRAAGAPGLLAAVRPLG